MKKLTIAVALTMAAGGAAAQYRPGPPVVGLSERDDGRSIRVPVDAEIRVQLQQQAGTAYDWQMRNDPHLQLMAEPTTQNRAPPGMVGGPQIKTFRVRVVAPGHFAMIFGLRSAVDGPDQVPARRILVTVDATDGRPAPVPPPRPNDDAQVYGERDAGFVITHPGREIVLRLPSNASTGYHWVIGDYRNLDLRAPIEIERGHGGPPGMIGGGDTTVIRLIKTSVRSDGFITLFLVPPGRREDRYVAVKTLDYHFQDDR